jgi:hypothetical protein
MKMRIIELIAVFVIVGILLMDMGLPVVNAARSTPLAPLHKAFIEICPETLNLRSKGNWVTCFITLPQGYDVGDINASTILLNESVPAEPRPVSTGDSHLMVKFNRTMISNLMLSEDIMYGNVTLTVAAQLYDGTMFEGSDTIRVIMPGNANGNFKAR